MGYDSLTADDRHARKSYLHGVLLLALGAVAFSSAGLFVRTIGRDAATILFWRGAFTVVAVTGFIAWRAGRDTLQQCLAIGRPGLCIAVASALSMACFISSLQYTSVANNSIIFGTRPFLTAGLAWLMIGERPSRATIACSLLALCGSLLVLGSSLSMSGAHLTGDALAVLMTLTFALKTVLVRQHADRSMVPAGCLAALLGSLGAAPFVPDWSIRSDELLHFALFGFAQQGAGLVLTTLGTARVPAAHAALLLTLDLPLGPTWVWLLLGERPTTLGLIGGLVVLTAILAHIAIEAWRQSRG